MKRGSYGNLRQSDILSQLNAVTISNPPINEPVNKRNGSQSRSKSATVNRKQSTYQSKMNHQQSID